jgi:thioredoxin-like negative regulator of GroEL
MITLVKFQAAWCAPCKMMSPVVAKVASALNLTVHEVDIDAEEGYTAQMGVRSVPTFVVLDSERNELGRFSGAMSADTLTQKIKSVLGEFV